MSEPERADGGARRARLPIVVTVLAVVGMAWIVGDGASVDERATGSAASDAVAAAAPGTRSTVWYCPGFPTRDGATAAVSLTNFDDVDASGAITALVDGGEPVREPVDVPAGEIVRVTRETDVGATLVEVFSDAVVVEEALIGPDVFVVAPCASTASDQWYFAAGTTVRGVEHFLVLLNPFDEAAVVDVTLLTDSGVQRPDSLRALDVAGGSRLVLPVHAASLRQPLVAMVVRARTGGRVVAAQSIVFGGDSGRRGVTRALGAVTPALRWQLADGRVEAGGRRSVAIMNPGDIDTEVDVQVVPTDPDVVVDPVTVTIGRSDVVAMQIGGCSEPPAATCIPVARGVDYSVLVTATLDVPVVVQDLATFTDAGPFTGAVSTLATREPARVWTFGRSAFRDQRASYLSVVNPGAEPTTVSVTLVVDGAAVEPAELQGVELPPGRRVRLPIGALGLGDGGIRVESAAPVVVERVAIRPDGITRVAGIPARESR
ncbi:MAG TPA: DUF5719 family protein [Acidimicrobiia bacterium]|nr:DUF5719 family protein [Acidimicrobiia bacterium]